jgi:hypothetical protein
MFDGSRAQMVRHQYYGARDYLPEPRGQLNTLTPRYRLALEMALHEESERRAMEGELAELERAWRDAEAVAEIADSMLLPEDPAPEDGSRR